MKKKGLCILNEKRRRKQLGCWCLCEPHVAFSPILDLSRASLTRFPAPLFLAAVGCLDSNVNTRDVISVRGSRAWLAVAVAYSTVMAIDSRALGARVIRLSSVALRGPGTAAYNIGCFIIIFHFIHTFTELHPTCTGIHEWTAPVSHGLSSP